MSNTRGTSALTTRSAQNHEQAGGLARAAHHGGEKSPLHHGEVPLRELLGDQVLDLLLERSRDGAGGLRLTGAGSMLGELVKAVLERALEAELSAHLGYGKHDPAGHGSGNSRNGKIGKTVQTGVGPVRLAVPRDRAGSFEPVLVPKRAGRVSGGLDDMIISLYAHGMSVRDIQHHLRQIYDTELSHEAISNITDAVLEEARAWQNRPLDPIYPVVFLDAIVVKVRDNNTVQAKPAYLAVGIDTDGEKHVLGICCAARRSVVFPVQPGGTRREVPGSDGLPGIERRREQEHARKVTVVPRRMGRRVTGPARYG
jgi:putative transposase